MGCDQGPTVTRHGMRRALALSLALVLAGCGGHSNVRLNTGGAPSGASTGTSVHVQSGTSTFGTLLAIGVMVGMSHGSDRALEEAGGYSVVRPPFAAPPAARVPELEPSRRVVEHDCTRPIEDWSANIKCK